MNVILLGPQGSGKGTQAKKLSDELGIPHVSTGDLLRDYVQQGGPRAEEVQRIMSEGALIDDDFLEEILRARIAREDCTNGFILDGTPRELEQAKLIRRIFEPKHVIAIMIPEEESMRRITKRAEIEHRADDTPEALKERLKLYHEKTEPVIKYYEDRGVLTVIDGMQPKDDVYRDLKHALGV